MQELGATLVLGMGFAAGLVIGMTISEVIEYLNRQVEKKERRRFKELGMERQQREEV